MTNNDETTAHHGLSVKVDMGDDFTPAPRTAAAIGDLLHALQEDYGGEVEGFQFAPPPAARGFIVSVSPRVAGDGTTQHFFTIEIGEGRVA